ncbi:hypothetical protein [Halospeciosus flavus]|uniref:DUF8159 domain-containing protein n=1 Tax=Halospeciosus flavus TaxID=3032283 RepID=A0ABD5Z0U6_9EURY|nr:hypothetical protein [Halospeciosus flavus]
MGDESDEIQAFQLESRLTSLGCYLREVERDGAVYRVEYESIAGDEHGRVPPREAGKVVNVFRDLFEERDWPLGGVEATVTDLDGEPLVTWRVDPDWMRALEAGDLTEVEFSRRVVDSFEDEGEN